MEVAPGTPEEKQARPPVDDDENEVSETSSSSESDSEDDGEMKAKVAALLERLKISRPGESEFKEHALSSFDLEGVARKIKDGAKRIIVMAGAGISVSAGIPDFRSPGTGLYANLKKYSLPRPEAVFDIDYFRENPSPFYMLAAELYPGQFCPTPTHCFIRLLHEKGLLLRCFTQNIDSLEVLGGLPEDKCVAAHGNFDGAHCIGEERHAVDTAVVKAAVEAGHPARCTQPGCGALLKPDIVFFGEALPSRFWTLSMEDFPACDLLIVMGTSLVVNPFASLIGHVKEDTPRVLINREKAGEVQHHLLASVDKRSFNFGEGNYRDVFVEGNCDDGCEKLAELLGWKDDLANIVESVRAKFPKTAPSAATPAAPASETDIKGGGGVAVTPAVDVASGSSVAKSPAAAS